MGIRSSYWKTRLALTGRESVETLTAMEGYFQGGAKWTQGVYQPFQRAKMPRRRCRSSAGVIRRYREILAGAGHCRKDRWDRHPHRKL